MIIPWRRGAAATTLVDDALSAVTAADWAAPAPPVALPYWPVDAANPYQALTYSRFAAHNLVPIRLHRLADLDGMVESLPAGTPVVLHVHWLYEVTKGSRSEAEARTMAGDFERRVERLRRAGIRLMWTVHNVLPHETKYPDVEARLRRFMLGAADVVHVMHDSHVSLLWDAFGEKARRVVVAPHPSFAGAYPDWIDARGARATLGLPLGARVLVTFGQIRPYKGHLDFLAAFDQATSIDASLRWLVAGKVRDEAGTQQFLRRAATHPAVLVHPGFIPDQDVQLYLRAADAAVFPYLRSLNSGAVALTATFDLPVYASNGTHLADLMPATAVRRFDLADRDATARALTTSWPDAEVRPAIREHLAGLRPDVVSDAFARDVRTWLDD
jgi:beta-1,4-mannosyltransferase